VNSKVNQVAAENDEDHPTIQENHDDIVEIKADLKHIKDGVDKINRKLEQ
jgi:hypothetical protein